VKTRLLALLLLSSCAHAPVRVSLAEPQPPPTARDYVDQLKKWTRHGELFYDFDQVLQVDATLRAPEFRAAYADKYVQLYRIPPDSAASMRGQLLTDGADSYEFHVESATHDYVINELGGTRSIWRLALVDDSGHEVTPSEVLATKVRREVDLSFYPYANVFTRGWRLRFPRTRADGAPLVGAETKALTLRFSGPRGSIDLVWQLQ
jgi:hypothetical protein